MKLTIELDDAAYETLRRRAAARGESPEKYAGEMLSASVVSGPPHPHGGKRVLRVRPWSPPPGQEGYRADIDPERAHSFAYLVGVMERAEPEPSEADDCSSPT